jgi:hypothetical protein
MGCGPVPVARVKLESYIQNRPKAQSLKPKAESDHELSSLAAC